LGVHDSRAQPAAAEQAKALSRAFRAAAEKAAPAVVTVVTRYRPSNSSLLFDGARVPIGPGDDGSVGSGTVIHAAGIVMTNSHVVEGASEVIVRTADGVEYLVEEIRRDGPSDVALLRIKDPPQLTVAKLGDSDQLEIGDWVLAIGSPFELDTTVSAGIISGKGRGIHKIQRGKLLQTDAAINPGNSGGPLVNLDGEVVGINVAIASSSGGYQGIGFAIPSNQARWVATQLMSYGEVRRAYLGVEIDDLIPPEARRLGLPPISGVRVKEVKANSPAANAGLLAKDVITEFAGMRVRDARDLQAIVEQQPPGSRHRMKIIRAGRTSVVDVTVERLDEDGQD
jgi:serine protease Do